MELRILLKKYREQKEMTIKKLAEISGISHGAIGEIERGKNNTKPATIMKLAKALELSPEETTELFAATLPQELQSSYKDSLQSNVKPVNDGLIDLEVRAKASAGNGFINFEEGIYTKSVRKNGFNSDCYLIEVVGNSMEPVIQDGSYIVVDPHQCEYVQGKIYVVTLEEETYIKKVEVNEELGLTILKSVNPKYDDIYVTKEKISELKIMGRAVQFILEGKL